MSWVELPRRRRNGRRWCRGSNDEERLARPDQSERATRSFFESRRVLRQPLTFLLKVLIFEPQTCDGGGELSLLRAVPDGRKIAVVANDGIDDEHAEGERKAQGEAAAQAIARILGAAEAAPGSSGGRSLIVARGINRHARHRCTSFRSIV